MLGLIVAWVASTTLVCLVFSRLYYKLKAKPLRDALSTLLKNNYKLQQDIMKLTEQNKKGR